MANNDIYTVRQLIEKFFNATLSDQESERLSGYAEDLTGATPSFKISDRQLLNDLELIKTLNRHSEASLEALALQTPDDLEKKLELHISSLSHRSRRQLLFKRIIPMTAAAAVVALVATIGFKATKDISIENVKKEQLTSAPNRNQDEQNVSEQDSQVNGKPAYIEINKPINNVASSASHSPAIKPTLPKQTACALSAVAAATIPEKIDLPVFSDPMIDVMPMIAAAAIDPSKVAIQPLSTLSQAVCNVYESVDIVSTSFAGLAETLDLVNSSLTILSATENEIQ